MKIPSDFDDLDGKVDELLDKVFNLIDISFDSPDEYEYYRKNFKRRLEATVARFMNEVNKDRMFDKDLFDIGDDLEDE